jgi:hypothetical protein
MIARGFVNAMRTRVIVVAGVAMALSIAAVLAFASASQASSDMSDSAASISSITVTNYNSPGIATITITGSDFGSAPTGGVSPKDFSDCIGANNLYGKDYGPSSLWLLDGSRSNGLYGATQWGSHATSTYGNCGGVKITSYSASEIVITLKQVGTAVLMSGDTVCVEAAGIPGCTELS